MKRVIENQLFLWRLCFKTAPAYMIYFLYDVVIRFITERFSVLSQLLTFLSIMDIFKILLPVSLIIGLGIGFVGSIVTVRKHLRV